MNSLCYKTSNNKYFKCPPRMDDGRHFTDYRPNCHTNNLVRTNNKIQNSFQYRMFLTRNANKLMTLNKTYNSQKNSCGPCQKPYNKGTMLPEATVVSCDKSNCYASVNDNNGLGQGRNYGNDVSCNWSNNDLSVNQESNC